MTRLLRLCFLSLMVPAAAGAQVTTGTTSSYPDRVTRLVLASPGLNGHVPAPPLTWTQPVFQAAGAGDAEGAARLWAETPIMATHGGAATAATVKSLVMSNVRLDLSHQSCPSAHAAGDQTAR